MRWKPASAPARRPAWTAFSPSRSIPPSWRKCSDACFPPRMSLPHTVSGMTMLARQRYSFRDYLHSQSAHHAGAGLFLGPAVSSGRQHLRLLAARRRHLAGRHRLSFLGRARLFAEIPLGARSWTGPDAPLLSALGRRRGWMALAQIVIAGGLVAMALSGRRPRPGACWACCALVVAFASATQDIAIDAWRIESAAQCRRAGLAHFRLYIRLSHRAAGHRGGDPAHRPAHRLDASYMLYGALMAIGLAAMLARRRAGTAPIGDGSARKRRRRSGPRAGFFDAVAGPFIVFFRDPWRHRHRRCWWRSACSSLPNFVSGPMYNPHV